MLNKLDIYYRCIFTIVLIITLLGIIKQVILDFYVRQQNIFKNLKINKKVLNVYQEIIIFNGHFYYDSLMIKTREIHILLLILCASQTPIFACSMSN